MPGVRRRSRKKSRYEPAGNGPLMRASPIPVFFARDARAMRRAALDDSAITHADPRCRIACAAFSAAIRHAIATPDATPQSMTDAAEAELRPAADAIPSPRPRELARRDDPGLDEGKVHFYRHMGFVRVAFRVAFWELLHAPTFEAAILDCANRGGDADTNAAIAGALYGALVGEDAIPAAWREKVSNACTGPGWEGNVWADAYHPRRLFCVAPGDTA